MDMKMEMEEESLQVESPETDRETALECRTLDPTQRFYFAQDEFKDMQRGIIIVAQEDEESPFHKILRENLRGNRKTSAKTLTEKENNNKDTTIHYRISSKSNNIDEDDDEEEEDNNASNRRQITNMDDDEEEGEESFEENRSRFSIITIYFDCIVDGCDGKFPKKKDRNNHIRTVHQIEPYACHVGDCDERANNGHQYARHMIQKHPEVTEWTCERCHNRPKFTVYHAYWKHNYTIHEFGQFGCPFKDCTFTAPIRKAVYNHICNRHPDLKYVCHHDGCEKVFSNGSTMMSHQLRAHLFLKPFKCTWPDCGYSSEVSSATLRHIRTVHFNIPSLKVQRETNMIDQRNPMDFLQRLVDPKRVLAYFGPIDKNDKGKVYKCSECTQTYIRRHNLIAHERIHTGVKPFKCIYNDCNQQFARKELACSHIRTVHFNLRSKRSKKRDRDESGIDITKYMEVIPQAVVQPETIIVEEETNFEQQTHQVADDLQIHDLQGQMFYIQTSDQEAQLIHFVEEQPEVDDSSPKKFKIEEEDEVQEVVIEQVQEVVMEDGQEVVMEEAEEEEVPVDENVEELTVDEVSEQTPLTNLMIHTGSDEQAHEDADDKEEVEDVEADYEIADVPVKKKRARSKRLYHCTHEGCGKGFARPALLRIHCRTHNGQRPYSCAFTSPEVSFCDFTATRKENLIQHIRTKHFNLPRSMKKQSQMNIVDQRDPFKFVRVDPTLLEDYF